MRARETRTEQGEGSELSREAASPNILKSEAAVQGPNGISIADGATPQREASKAARRGKIIDAAHNLLREVGVEGASIREIARRAGVSPTTLFNLCGSKETILSWVSLRDLGQFKALVEAQASKDSLSRLFDSFGIAEKLFADDPKFYRAIMALARNIQPAETIGAFRDHRALFFARQLQLAEEDGYLKLGPNAASVTVLFSQTLSGVVSDWVSGAISAPQWRRETCMGMAVILLPFSTEVGRARLETYRQFFLMELSSSRERAHQDPSA